MRLQKVPAAVALGLLASLGAHALLFRGDHAMGGAYHSALLEGAGVAIAALLVLLGALAWTGSRYVAAGSILATRLRDRLPALGPVVAASAAWYALAEAMEPHHAGVSSLAVLCALAFSAWLVLRSARWVADLLSGAVIAIRRVTFAPRTPARLRPRAVPVFRAPVLWRRRFARPPPPIASVLRA